MVKAIPSGISSFDEIRSKQNGMDDFYYVDKTMMIRDLLMPKPAKVTLITRPRRFGKSLNMSMLECFLDINRKDDHLFDGLRIMDEQRICQGYMHKYPIIHVSFKDVRARSLRPSEDNLSSALVRLKNTIGFMAMEFDYLQKSDKLSKKEKVLYERLATPNEDASEEQFIMSLDTLKVSLGTLASLIKKDCGIAPVLLIDEYDVPLNDAFEKGYYLDFIEIYKTLLSSALKDNKNISFAVVAGCLKISKESIFTGINNLAVMDVTSVEMDEYFGFDDDEARRLLDYYGLASYYNKAKKFYDGYRFGSRMAYNPWSLIEFIRQAVANREKNQPVEFGCGWINTSGNAILNSLLEKAQGDASIAEDVDTLENGSTIKKRIVAQLTFDNIYDSIDSIWTVMLHSGYLTCEKKLQNGILELRVSNQEVLLSFDELVKELALHQASNGRYQKRFCEAVRSFDPARMEEEINRILENSVSIRDSQTKAVKENFYHGILLSALLYREDWDRQSNPETGDGYCDIMVQNEAESWGIIFELKYSRAKKSFAAALEKGKQQIIKCKYN